MPVFPACESEIDALARQMLADGISRQHYMLASTTATYWHLVGDEMAAHIWEVGQQ